MSLEPVEEPIQGTLLRPVSGRAQGPVFVMVVAFMLGAFAALAL
jgi:hypothetical protein